MLINNPEDYKVGDIVLYDGNGPAFTILSSLLGHWDKQWKQLKRKPWHTAFLTRQKNGVWFIGEAHGKNGVQEARLDSYKEKFLVFRWFDKDITQSDVEKFLDSNYGAKYDNFLGYLFTILWFFVSWFPRIIDRKYMCWEFVYLFVDQFGKSFDSQYKYPLITIMMDKLGYPDY